MHYWNFVVVSSDVLSGAVKDDHKEWRWIDTNKETKKTRRKKKGASALADTSNELGVETIVNTVHPLLEASNGYCMDNSSCMNSPMGFESSFIPQSVDMGRHIELETSCYESSFHNSTFGVLQQGSNAIATQSCGVTFGYESNYVPTTNINSVHIPQEYYPPDTLLNPQN